MSRISALPRYNWLDDADVLVEPMTAWLRAPTGTMRLRSIQAAILYSLGTHGGVLAAARVGAGKTLPLALGATVLGAQRPLLILPAADVKDKRAEYRELRRHWQIPANLKIISYHKLSRAQPCKLHGKKPCDCERPTYLEEYQPDYCGCDEAQALRYLRDSARGRKFARFAASPAGHVCHFMFCTGTPARVGGGDYWHMLVWALRHGAPVPLEPEVREEWSVLIDDPKEESRGGKGQLSYAILQPHLGPTVVDRDTAREAFADRLESTPGVIISRDLFEDVPLTIEPIYNPTPPALDEHWRNLRDAWALPDGWLLADKSLSVFSAAQQMALGFYYTADPWPPTDWLEAYKTWARFCRMVLESSDTLDSESQVKDACRSGQLPDWALCDWEAIAPSFTRHTVAVWLSTHTIERAATWGRGGGIVWSTYTAFGRALAERTGWPYYGAEGRDANGRSINKAAAPTIIASTHSCSTSRNLQIGVGPDGIGYARNLFATPPQKAIDWEQRIGRTHRELQTRPVTVDYLVGCLENFVAPHVGVSYARRTEAIERLPQKLLHCTLRMPDVSWAKGPAFGE
jgi:hypothetical protein